MKDSLTRLDEKLEEVYPNERHRFEATNGVFCSCLRNDINPDQFLDDVESGDAFDFEAFKSAKQGNLLDFLKADYRPLAQGLIDITAGGNGGMASIGRGEFYISFLSNFDGARISTAGRGDLEYATGFEEVKHNGGKIAIDKKAGNEIHRTFLSLIETTDIELKSKRGDYLPTRKTDETLYDCEVKTKLNGYYYQAITGVETGPITDEDFARKCFKRAFDKLFESIDTLLIINEKNDFVRFFDAQSACNFYSDKLNILKGEFEIRNFQNNAPSFYVGKEEVSL